uniref:Uncharacterized protein n=1 Tax=Anguilla anguilla TaxID=7936 RepID=A0A0E9STF6_ANGAN
MIYKMPGFLRAIRITASMGHNCRQAHRSVIYYNLCLEAFYMASDFGLFTTVSGMIKEKNIACTYAWSRLILLCFKKT